MIIEDLFGGIIHKHPVAAASLGGLLGVGYLVFHARHKSHATPAAAAAAAGTSGVDSGTAYDPGIVSGDAISGVSGVASSSAAALRLRLHNQAVALKAKAAALERERKIAAQERHEEALLKKKAKK